MSVTDSLDEAIDRRAVAVLPTLEQDQGAAIVGAWNAHHRVGTPVVLVDDLGRLEWTKTRTLAWCLGHGEPVVSVEGRTGGYILSRIIPVRLPESEAAEAPRMAVAPDELAWVGRYPCGCVCSVCQNTDPYGLADFLQEEIAAGRDLKQEPLEKVLAELWGKVCEECRDDAEVVAS